MDDMRKRGDWMMPVDDPILEFLQDEGWAKPETVANALDKSPGYMIQRLSELMNYGLVSRAARGVYVITDDGEAYLNEQLDASELEPDSD